MLALKQCKGMTIKKRLSLRITIWSLTARHFFLQPYRTAAASWLR